MGEMKKTKDKSESEDGRNTNDKKKSESEDGRN